MLTIETVEVAYTLAELAELDDRGRAYERAIEKTTQYANEGGEYCQFISEDLQYWLEQQPAISDVTNLEWDYDRSDRNNFKCDVQISVFMRSRKLHTKYRALWYAMAHLGCFDTYLGIEADKAYYYAHALVDWESDLERYTDLYEEDRKRYDLIIHQIAQVGAAISDYVSDLLSEVRRIVEAEIDYRYSEEFAKEEAEALELHFDEEGNILHI